MLKKKGNTGRQCRHVTAGKLASRLMGLFVERKGKDTYIGYKK